MNFLTNFLKLCPFRNDYNSPILAEFRDKKNILVHRFAPRNYTPGKHNQFDETLVEKKLG